MSSLYTGNKKNKIPIVKSLSLLWSFKNWFQFLEAVKLSLE